MSTQINNQSPQSKYAYLLTVSYLLPLQASLSAIEPVSHGIARSSGIFNTFWQALLVSPPLLKFQCGPSQSCRG
jgi:hypothetical protein